MQTAPPSSMVATLDHSDNAPQPNFCESLQYPPLMHVLDSEVSTVPEFYPPGVPPYEACSQTTALAPFSR